MRRLLGAGIALLGLAAVAADDPLPRFAPLEPAEALKTFQTRDGFRLDLLAAEPLTTDPVAAAYDEDGRLYVVEMLDYPHWAASASSTTTTTTASSTARRS